MLGMNNTHCIFHKPPSTHTHTCTCTFTHAFSPSCFLERSDWGFPRDAGNIYASHFAAMASYAASLCHVSPRKCIMDSSFTDRMPTMSSWNQPNRRNKDHSDIKNSWYSYWVTFLGTCFLQHTKVKYQTWSHRKACNQSSCSPSNFGWTRICLSPV